MKRWDERANWTRWLVAAVIVAALSWGQPAAAEDAAAGQDAESLAKKLNNPVSDLVSVPFQFNWAQPVGPDDDTRLILNVQPVMPFSITKDWNLISRVILPFIGQPPLSQGGQAASGLGDVLASFFFSPKAGRPIWGVGPAFSLPSTSEPTLGSGKWSGGPTLVVLEQQGRWTYGVLANQLWSFAGNDNRDSVSQAFLQPFFAYTTAKAVSYGMNSETTANWKADGKKWTVPINFMLSKVSTFGPFPASYQAGVGYYVSRPDGAPDWQLRATVTLLLPKK
jgi:hypothetical protein